MALALAVTLSGMSIVSIDVFGGDTECLRSGAFESHRLLKLITGATITRAGSSGVTYREVHKTSASDTTPYVGVVVDLTKNVSAYASHTGIFDPQTQVDIKGVPLDPAKGKSKEVGLKSEFFDRRLNASIAVFKTK